MNHHKIKSLLTISGILLGAFLCSHSAYATSYINVSSGSGGTISFGSIKPTSTGASATASDTLTVHTDCSAGYSVYVSGQSGKDTNLTNKSAESDNIISTSSTAIGDTATTLSSNTWGLNSENTGSYVGLPTYDDALTTALTTKSNVAESSTVNIYYGLKVNTALTPGTYTGDVLYTVLMNSSCVTYTVVFDANGGSGGMVNQSIMAGTATALTANSFTRSGYTFLGWSTKATGKTETAVGGIGTEADVDYANRAEVTDLTSGGSSITLYAIWGNPDDGNLGTMQDFICNNLNSGHTATLTDARDGQAYSVYRIPVDQTYAGTSTIANVAGKCIMTQDLNLGAVASVSGASSTIEANGTMTLSPNDSEFTAPTGSGESITIPTSNVTVSPTYSNVHSYENKYYKADGTEGYAGRGYYSWGAAMVVCPRNWRLPTIDEYNNNYSSYEAATAGISAIVKGEDAAGSIANATSAPWSFVQGGYYGSYFLNFSELGGYWVSTSNSDGSIAYRFNIATALGLSKASAYTSNGYAVRCISDPATTTMQDFDAATFSTTVGTSTRLIDSRDDKVYTVKRLPDGKVWMMQNLTIGMDGAKTLTPADTNIDDGKTCYLPPAGKQGSSTIDDASTLTATDTANFTSLDSNDPHAKTQFRAKDSSIVNDSDTGYYNFYTATLGFAPYGGSVFGSSTRDICPKGWRLPNVTSDSSTITSSSPAEFTTLAKAYNADASWTSTTTSSEYRTRDSKILEGMYTGIATNNNSYAGFSYSGEWNGTDTKVVGTGGPYWSSSVFSAERGRFMYFDSSLSPQQYRYKDVGIPIRCLAQNKYTINYSNSGATSGNPSKTIDGTQYDNAALTLPTVGNMVKSGYAFKGWAFTSGATTVAYNPGASVSVISLAAAASAAGQTVAPGSTIILYPVWELTKLYMQTTSCSSLTINTTTTLYDSRDEQAYTIYRWPSSGTAGTSYPTSMAGYCIMTKDLSLGYVTGGSITKGTNLTLTTATSAAAGTIIARTGTSDWNTENVDSNLQYINGTNATYGAHAYYSYGAAQKVCPKGWRPPTKTEYDNIATFMGGNNSTGSSKIRGIPYSFVYGGYFSSGGWGDVGGWGYYWSSTQSSSASSGGLGFTSSNISANDNNNKNSGLSVRCVAAP